jgi:hypothetical protein
MATELKSVKITNAGLHDSPLRGGTIILRGVIDPDSLRNLYCDTYQREALPQAKLGRLVAAVQAGQPLPDIEIGMRGQKYRSVKDDWYLQDTCYIIDGQQRTNACIRAIALYPGLPVHLGAAIHFDTDKDWETERFHILNANRTKLSPNVLLRNMREKNVAIATLYGLSNSENSLFSLGGKVSWDQNMKREKLITALNMLRVVLTLHKHMQPIGSHSVTDLSVALENLAEKITLSMMRDNTRMFFDAVDEIWGIRSVQYRELSRHLQGGFLEMLARIFSNHLDFWKGVNGHRLFVDSDFRRKIKSFPLNDPGISPLASSAGASRHILYDLVVKHVNSGKRIKRLQPRLVQDNDFSDDTE